jgi:hypothetical protein
LSSASTVAPASSPRSPASTVAPASSPRREEQAPITWLSTVHRPEEEGPRRVYQFKAKGRKSKRIFDFF